MYIYIYIFNLYIYIYIYIYIYWIWIIFQEGQRSYKIKKYKHRPLQNFNSTRELFHLFSILRVLDK